MQLKEKCFTIGLTGGIASGKSAVSRLFEQYNCAIIDADLVAREAVKPNSKGLKQLVSAFGRKILTKNNQLDRAKLREIVFKNDSKLATLNAILHPLIQTKILERVNAVTDTYCIVVIPLLCESSRYEWLDRILVVDVKTKTQLHRLIQRDSISVELANNMMNSQCKREQRLSIADDVINNEQSLEVLEMQVKILNSLYKSL